MAKKNMTLRKIMNTSVLIKIIDTPDMDSEFIIYKVECENGTYNHCLQ